MQQKQLQREVYSNTILPQETRKTLNRQPNFTPKTTGKIRTKNPKNQQKERNINTWSLNNTFLNNEQVTEEIKRETKEFIETNDSGNMTTHNLFDTAKAVLRGKFIAIQSYLKK